LFRAAGVVVEVSGGRGHSSAADRAKDARRRNDLQQLGRIVLEFTYEDVTRRRHSVADTVRAALTRPPPPPFMSR
jgi:very-short-patch-repair endonuclease